MRRSVLFCIVLIAAAVSLTGQRPAPSVRPDPEIRRMIREVSAKNVEANIRKLVSFGTRNTLSDQEHPTRGIGAARDWIFGEFEVDTNHAPKWGGF